MSDKEYKKTVETAFDAASAGYDSPAMRFFDNSAKELVRQAPLKGTEHVLDVATGTGKVAIEAARRLRMGRVTAIDLSQGMLAQARRKASEQNIPNILFEQADVDRTAFGDGAFDGLFCSFGVHFWADMERSLSRLIKQLKNGAFVAITSFAKGSFEPQSELTLKRFTRYGIKLPTTYTWEKLDSEEKNRALFQKLGLEDIRVRRLQMGYLLDDPDQWWDLVRFTGFRAFLNKMTPEQIDRFRAENMAETIKTSENGKIRLNVDVFFTTALTGRVI